MLQLTSFLSFFVVAGSGIRDKNPLDPQHSPLSVSSLSWRLTDGNYTNRYRHSKTLKCNLNIEDWLELRVRTRWTAPPWPHCWTGCGQVPWEQPESIEWFIKDKDRLWTGTLRAAREYWMIYKGQGQAVDRYLRVAREYWMIYKGQGQAVDRYLRVASEYWMIYRGQGQAVERYLRVAREYWIIYRGKGQAVDRYLRVAREYWMFYRGPGFFSRSYDMVLPILPLSPVSKLDRLHIGRLRKRDNKPTEEGWGGGYRGAKSYDRKKAWCSINLLILSGRANPVRIYSVTAFFFCRKSCSYF